MSLEGFDPFSASVIADPYPWYARLHEGPRIVYLEKRDRWVLSRHEDVRAALRDHSRLSSQEGVSVVRAPLPMMLTMDPPDHERLRRIIGREFAPRDVHRFRPDVERFVGEGLDDMRSAGGTADLVESLAVPVPIRLMGAILGVPESDIPPLREKADDLIRSFSLAPTDVASVEEIIVSFDFELINRAISGIHGYFDTLIEERMRAPTDDLVTRLAQPAAEGALSRNELLWFCLLLLVAGIETTTNLIGNMVLAFHENPDQWREVCRRPELIGSAVNEALRYDSPIQGFYRTALEPYEVDGVEIPERARVLLLFGAANRDPLHYLEPDAFRIERDPTDHVAFGSGIHRCLGAGLAELEGRIVLEALVGCAETVEVDGPIVRTANPILRGVAQLPVTLKKNS